MSASGSTSGDSSAKVSYEGDKAHDAKRAEHHTALALKAKRRGDVFVHSMETSGSLDDIPKVPKNDASKIAILKAIETNVLFNDLGEKERSLMVDSMKEKSCTNGETLIVQGEMGDRFYVNENVLVDFVVDGVKVGEGKPGSTFGELALLYNSPRAATVIARSNGLLWSLPRDTFRRIVSSSINKGRQEIQTALKSVSLLQDLSDQQISQLCDIVAIVSFRPGDVIIRKGDQGSVFYFIKSGTVQCTKIGDQESELELGPGEYFGERSLMKLEPRAANVIAKTAVDCLALDKSDFDRLLGGLMATLDKNLGIRVLKALPIFKELNNAERDEIVEEFQLTFFQDGEHIVRQGEHGDTFYIIKEGAAIVSKLVENTGSRAVIATLKVGDYFGEGALLRDEPRGADVVAKGQVKAFVLDRASFDRHMSKMKGNLTQHLSVRLDQTDDAVKQIQRGVESQIQFQELTQIRTLGTGTFGRVKLVEHKKLKMTFALKILQKAQIVAYGQQVNVMNEKNILAECDHPFILRLFKTFKDKNCLYMLLELVQGGELFGLLHVHGGKLEDKHARFYAACVLDALEYLHDRTICYRDLKPENLMIASDGYLKVVDFGFAKRVKDKTYTLCGTPEYLAPELVLGKGHNKGVDYWALGILIFEMVTGGSPFADPVNGDHMVICKNIVRAKIMFPSIYPEKAKDLTQQLLVREAHMRLGCLRNGARDIKEHAWFKSLSFNELYRRRMKAPWVPSIKSATDTSNFDSYEEDDSVETYHEPGAKWDAEF